MTIDLTQLVTAEMKVATAAAAQQSGILAQIDKLERDSMLNRGSREMQIYLCEKEAQEYSDIYGLSVAVILSGNVYYPKLKALDAEAKELRNQLI